MQSGWVGLLLAGLVCVSAWSEDLDVAVAANHCQLQISGDGHTSRRVQLTLKNTLNAPVKLRVARYTTLEHSVLLLEEKQIDLPARGSVKATLTAMTYGRREQAPPAEKPELSHPGAPGGDPLAVKASQLYEAALKQAKSFPDLPITPSQRPLVIAQLAFWRSQGQLTPEQLKAMVQAQLHAEGPDATKELDEGVAGVWKATDMVLNP